jgi:hypothetical protein
MPASLFAKKNETGGKRLKRGREDSIVAVPRCATFYLSVLAYTTVYMHPHRLLLEEVVLHLHRHRCPIETRNRATDVVTGTPRVMQQVV